jgi:hypothetical protein
LALKKAGLLLLFVDDDHLLGAGLFDDIFCAFRHSVLGQFWTGDGRSFVVVSQT